MMLDERRNLLSDDLQWFRTKILTQKFTLFGFLEVEGKKKWRCVVACWVLNENSTERDLTHAAWVNSRTWVNSHKGKIVFSFENERNCLGKKQNSSINYLFSSFGWLEPINLIILINPLMIFHPSLFSAYFNFRSLLLYF